MAARGAPSWERNLIRKFPRIDFVAPVQSPCGSEVLSARSRNPLVRFRQLLPVLVPLLMYALRHAGQMSVALEARGFSLHRPRTSYLSPRFTPWDGLVLVVLAVVFAGCLALRLQGHGTVFPDRI